MPEYRVADGHTFGKDNCTGIVTLTEPEAATYVKRGWLLPVSSELPDISSMTIPEVLSLVESGELSAADALALEKKGKQRKTLLAVLSQE